MPVSFLPSSPFGVYGLQQLLESRGTYIAVQLLNVPEAAPGNRSTWTWTANWSQYAIAGAFSGTGGNLDVRTQGASPPSAVAVYEEATSAFPGAYYDTDYSYPGNGYVYMYNASNNTYTYTHVAVFVMQQNAATLNSIQFSDQSLLTVEYPYDYETEQPTTGTLLPGYANLFGFALPDFSGGASVTIAEGWDGWLADDQQRIGDLATFTAPYPIPYTTAYRANRQETPALLSNYKALLGVTDQDGITSFLAELLNVTGAEPDFEEGWTGWSTYRINRYSVASVSPNYTYTPREHSYIEEYEGIDYLIEFAGTEVSQTNYTEFIFIPPAAGSFTFTHIAVFVNEVDAAPQQGSTYTYPDENKLVGVIKLPTSVTMSSTSEQRGFPFQFSFMGPPDYEITELGS